MLIGLQQQNTCKSFKSMQLDGGKCQIGQGLAIADNEEALAQRARARSHYSATAEPLTLPGNVGIAIQLASCGRSLRHIGYGASRLGKPA